MIQSIEERINQRRRQILVHSYLYYEMNDSVISDKTWSDWASELVALQREYPTIADKCIYANDFKDFDGSTGFHFHYEDKPEIVAIAKRHIKMMGGGGPFG